MAIAQRRKTTTVKIGRVSIGSDHPLVVQSMTNTDTADVEATVAQIEELYEAGAEIVRVTVNNDEAARAVPRIVDTLAEYLLRVPIVGDFHYNGHLLLTRYPECAAALNKYRINPGNVGGKRRDEHFRQIIEVAIEHSKPVRIGVNWGSLDQALLTELMDANAELPEPLPASEVTREALVTSALRSALFAEEIGLGHDKIVLSAKVSSVQELVEVYTRLAARCDYPLHLGLTEAGIGMKGEVASTLGIGLLLQQGIGDTIRVSTTPDPFEGKRSDEVRIAQQIIQSLGLRDYVPQVTSCPGCGRTTSQLFQEMADEVEQHIGRLMPVWKADYPGAESLKIAVMGCVVNGPGESKHANIGISLPGTAEDPKAPVYVDGKLLTTLQGPFIMAEFLQIIDRYVIRNFSGEPEENLPELAPKQAGRDI